MKAIIVFTLSTLLLSGCSSQPKVDNNNAYEVSREERLYTQCVGQVSELTNDNRRVITVEGSIRAVSGCVGVAKQLK